MACSANQAWSTGAAAWKFAVEAAAVASACAFFAVSDVGPFSRICVVKRYAPIARAQSMETRLRVRTVTPACIGSRAPASEISDANRLH